MAHQQQQDFFKDICARFPDKLKNASKILEVGSQNLNGSVRVFFPEAREYLGIDLGLAEDVDWTIPGELIELPDGWADVVISTECFEHCRDWDKVFINMIRIGKPDSLILITCAGVGRAAHGTIDSNESDSPFTTSYYKNLGVDDITPRIAIGMYFTAHGFEVNSRCHDLYFWGLRSGTGIQKIDHYWEEPMNRLARAQGQLGQAAARHSAIVLELSGLRVGAEQARAEAEQARAEAEQARAQANEKTRELRNLQESTTWKITKPVRCALDKCKKLFKD